MIGEIIDVLAIPEEELDEFLNAQFEECFRDDPLVIERVIFKDPATIVFWDDGTKTVVKCCKEDKFDREVGLKTAILRKCFGKKIDKVIKAIIADDDNA